MNCSGLPKSDSPSSVKADNIEVPVEDEQFARMMARLDELEKQELAAESDEDESDEDEHTVKDEDYARMMSRLDELENQELTTENFKEIDEEDCSEAYFGMRCIPFALYQISFLIFYFHEFNSFYPY